MGGFLTAVERPKAAISISVGRGLLFQAGALLLLAAAVGGTGIWFAPVISEALCAVMAVWFLRRFPAENRSITNIKKYPAAQPRDTFCFKAPYACAAFSAIICRTTSSIRWATRQKSSAV